MKQSIFSQFLVAVLAAALVIGLFQWYTGSRKNIIIEHVDKSAATNALYTLDDNGSPVPMDFTGVAEKSLGTVVHILSTSGVSRSNSQERLLEDFFGDRRSQRPQIGSGSGVIINSEGYIVTNNHVIKDAEDLEVVLNDKRKFKAKLIGTDPQTDIAVIKIEQNSLPVLKFSNSDAVKIGQWVLAIGNPFNLTSTVTAGIVSAKGRSIALFDQNISGIESFIQTDAAINPGNSGGALIDLNGNLIGINTAIASQTGSYAGYGFAVPSNLASRVVSDLIQYGTTQRGYLGVSVNDIDANFAKLSGLQLNEGAYIASVLENSAAHKAGILPKDVVTEINARKVSSRADLMEIVGSHRIGDKLKLKVDRKGQVKYFEVVLKNQSNSASLITPPITAEEFASNLGAELNTIDAILANQMGITGGVQVENLQPGILANSNIEEGFIITKINKKPVTKPSEVIDALRKNTDGVYIEGIYPGSNQRVVYGIDPQ